MRLALGVPFYEWASKEANGKAERLFRPLFYPVVVCWNMSRDFIYCCNVRFSYEFYVL